MKAYANKYVTMSNISFLPRQKSHYGYQQRRGLQVSSKHTQKLRKKIPQSAYPASPYNGMTFLSYSTA